MTRRQELFIGYYTAEGEDTFLNASKSAVKSGYSQKTARFIGAENLTKPNIAKAVGEEMKRRAEERDISRSNFAQKTLDLFKSEARPSVKVQYWKMIGECIGALKPQQNIQIQKTGITQEDIDRINKAMSENEPAPGTLPPTRGDIS